jgi:hypothetical protein
LNLLLLVFGPLVVVGILVCGSIVYFGYQASQGAKEKTEAFRAKVQELERNAKPDPAPDKNAKPGKPADKKTSPKKS